MAKLARRKTNAPSGQRTVSEHHRARNQEARGTHDARSNLLNRDADAEISRAPEDIDQPEGNNDLPSARGRSNAHGIRWETQNTRTKLDVWMTLGRTRLSNPRENFLNPGGFISRCPW